MVIIPPKATGFQSTKAKERDRKTLQQRQRSLLDRIAPRPEPERETPMITPANIHYELGRRVQGLVPGGIGAMLLVARRTGLIAAIDHRLHLLKQPPPLFRVRPRPQHRLQPPRRRRPPRAHRAAPQR